jgi:O-antigen/teichoic acid export membrane protein
MQEKSLSSNAFWSVFSQVWGMAVVFFMAPFLIHRIGHAHYGVYLFLSSLSGMLGVLNLGLGEATLRYVAYYHGRGDNEGINRVLGATLFIYAIMGTAAAAALFFFAPQVGRLLRESAADQGLVVMLVQITSLGFLLRFMAGAFLAVPQAALRYDLYARVILGESVVRTIGQVLVVLAGWGIMGLILWSAAAGLFLLAATVLLVKYLIPDLSLWQMPSRQGFREVFGYGVFAFLSQLLGLVWQYADRLLLGAFVGASAIAFFAVPQELAMRFLGLAAAAGAVLFPKFSRTEDMKRIKVLYVQSTSALLFLTVMLFVPLAVLFPDFIRLWVSTGFAEESRHVAVIIAASCIIRGAFIPYEGLFRGIGKPQYYLVVIALSSMTVLLCDLVLIPRYGIRGAGYAFCLSPLWGVAAIVFAWHRVLRNASFGELFRCAGGPCLVGFAMLAVGCWMRSFCKPDIGWLAMIGLAGAIFGLTTVCLIGYGFTLGRQSNPFAYALNLVRNAKVMRTACACALCET